MLRFEWDEAKSRENLRKHRVSFEEAETVVYDERGVLIDDDEPAAEERLVLIVECAIAHTRCVPHVPPKRPIDSIDLRGQTARSARKNPYARREAAGNDSARRGHAGVLQKLAEDSEVPYQTLINLFLRDCARSKKRLLRWEAA